MLGYIFFHDEPLGRCVRFLNDRGLSTQQHETSESLLVSLDEGSVDDKTADGIDD